MAIIITLELNMTADEMYDDIYMSRKIIESMISDWEERASKVDIETELLRLADEDGREIYNITDGWE